MSKIYLPRRAVLAAVPALVAAPYIAQAQGKPEKTKVVLAVGGKSADVKEGVTAFLEKRPARFPMKVSDGMPSYFPWWTERKFR